MKKIDHFTGCYSVSKTLRFKLIPVGKTQENIVAKRLLEEDENRAEDYKAAKKIIDRYHKSFIDDVLKSVKLSHLNEYASLFLKGNRSSDENETLEKLEETLRNEISKAFTENEGFALLFKKELIEDELPERLEGDELRIINSFKGFTTAFSGFHENRRNMYAADKKSTAIAFRCVNENLQRFLQNIACFEKIKCILDADMCKTIESDILSGDYSIRDFFVVDFYNLVLTQQGIDLYNALIGGVVKEDGRKIQGLNECINLHNQQNKDRLPHLKPLYKQVLSDRTGESFYGEGLTSDEELYDAMRNTVGFESMIYKNYRKAEELFASLDLGAFDGIYVKNGPAVTNISNDAYGHWGNFTEKWNEQYDLANEKSNAKDLEKFEEKRRKDFKKIESFSLGEIIKLMEDNEKLPTAVVKGIKDRIAAVEMAYANAKTVLTEGFKTEKQLKKDEVTVGRIKALLDSLKELESFLKQFKGTGKESGRNELFYGDYTLYCDMLSEVDELYNSVRNYVTQKPYSTDKFKLYFQNPQFLNGWDRNKETDYQSVILRNNDQYYLGIMDSKSRDIFRRVPESDEKGYEKMVYKQIPNASKYLSSKQINPQNPPEEIVRILEKKKTDNRSLTADEIKTFISYIQDDFLKNYSFLRDEKGKEYFDFKFKKPEAYRRLNDFFDDVDKQGYSVKFSDVPKTYVDSLVEKGELYLFRIYNKDFSEASHGTPNLHTMYFRSLFDGANQGVIRLAGEAEMFMRRASIKKDELIVHPANTAINNKNPLNPRKTRTLPYDVIKDRRFSEDQYELHMAISINKIPENGIKINHDVRKFLREDENPYVIGIDRGERNLLYVVVIDGKGKIVEQHSLNEIINEIHDVKIVTDYHFLLDQKEKDRLAARQDWTTIENIKELKEGYISQVVHKICELVEKYDAMIALEDLNSGFKNSRVKVEKQVYQKFEKMLIDKLNYLVNKKTPIEEKGSVIHGYQLTNKFESFKTMGTQNGIMFYIPAWLTSKIDPTTGFSDLLKPKYTNMESARSFVGTFDFIRYNGDEGYYEFGIDYSKFGCDADHRKKWTLCSQGSRIRTFRNPLKNNEWDNEEVNLTEMFDTLFEKYKVNGKSGDLRDKICGVTEADFYKEFYGLLRLMLQMRNSITGRTDVDYLISPVKNRHNDFFDTRNADKTQPMDADANGAYNIARKVLWAIEVFKKTEEDKLDKTKIAISNKEWLKFAQTMVD
ncbi:MAG: type V CRISPR-associated protein Cas12a/Cpf1 [Lachnospiraceae bacterium]|nr:type V CRISPR-associated protein Cas12a/Cpf1 [Lachnospiraceae bacterium]